MGPGHREGLKRLQVIRLQEMSSRDLEAVILHFVLEGIARRTSSLRCSEQSTRAGLPEGVASGWHAHQQRVLARVLHAVLLEFGGRLGDLDPLHAGLELELLHHALQGAHAGPGRHGGGAGLRRRLSGAGPGRELRAGRRPGAG